VGIKWPNDIYVDKGSKVGGILATTTLLGSRVLLNLGCGLNLDNARPTVGLNDTLERCGSPRLTLEHYVALVFNQLENLLHLLAEGRLEQILELYHKHWLHSGSRVSVTEHDGSQYSAQVVGIDRFGFLRVRKECGMEVTVHPDGNSFDMIQGLVVPK
jgi:biotin---protein ligase